MFRTAKHLLPVLLSVIIAATHAAECAGQEPPAATGTAGCAAGDPVSGLAARTIGSGGAVRRYVVYVPGRYAAHRPAPAVIDLHGSGSNPQQQLAISGMAAAAETHGFVVLLPVAVVPFAGGGFTWNIPADASGPDDVRYVADVLDDASRRLCLDHTRIYATGFSGGARLASEVACAHAGRIAALGAVGGLRAPTECDRPVPVIAFHGTSDPINPYAGGGPDYWRYGVEPAVAAWVHHNRCAPIPARSVASAYVEKVTYVDCAAGAQVALYRLGDTGHVWPGSTFTFPAQRFGPMSQAVDATAAMLSFFEQYRLAWHADRYGAARAASHESRGQPRR